MAKPAARIAFLHLLLLAGFLVVLGRAAQVQLLQHERWAERAERTRTERVALPARRGTIYDRHREPLAVAQAFYQVAVAANEVRDTTAVLRRLEALRADTRRLRTAFRPGGPRWVPVAGRYTAAEVEPLRDLRGVHLSASYRRNHPRGEMAALVLGALDAETGHGRSGLELMLDSLLRGVPGEQIFLKDRQGRRYESPQRRLRDPVDGHDVLLTLDADLQAIAETMLADAVRRMRADGGDVVFVDPTTGELLAVASLAGGGDEPSLSAFTAPFEPGSTAKLFTAAALLLQPGFDSTRTVRVDEAPYAIAGRGAPITDAKVTPGEYSLAHAIEVSSNVATVKFGQLLRPEEHYRILRDFGFGARTGVEFPSEAGGRVPRPPRWKPADEGPSISMGYGFEVTPVQLALAYAAIANAGTLVAPALVREVRDPAGRVLYRHRPDTVRRVVPPEVARVLLDYLGLAAGESGTGSAAQLARFRVAGKTGTSRKLVDGRYQAIYFSSFAGVFPADDPQLVVVVRIDNPSGAFYGGETAAPLTREMLEQALQARQGAVDRSRLARAAGRVPVPEAPPRGAPAVPVVVLLDEVARPDSVPPAVVPEVSGLSIREAAHRLHREGLQVRLVGRGLTVLRAQPAPGTSVRAGALVTLETGGR